jgi:Secretion system C-terminal sorting domain
MPAKENTGSENGGFCVDTIDRSLLDNALCFLQQFYTLQHKPNYIIMKKTLFYWFIIGLLFPQSLFSQWQMAEGLEGGRITSMISIDSVLIGVCGRGGDYSGTKGIFAKSDNGKWEMSNSNNSVLFLKKAGKCAFASSSRSFDYGQTWEVVPNISSSIHTVDTVIFNYSSTNDELKRSFDYGDNFETVDLPVQYPMNRFFSGDSLLLWHCESWNYEHKLFYSDDFGTNWDSITTTGLFTDHTDYNFVQFNYLNNAFWVQLFSNEVPWAVYKLFVFNHAQEKWIDVTNNLPTRYWHNHLFEYHNNIFCSIETYPVFKFNDSDSSWSEFTNGSKTVNQFLEHKGELFCATEQGAFSLDTNGNWTSFNEGLHFRNITSIDTHNDDIFVTANSELFYSVDGGHTFTKQDNAWGTQIITTDTVFYMISPHEFNMSWDEGETWLGFSDNLETLYHNNLRQLSISENYYYVAALQGLYRSPTDTIAWGKLENGSTALNSLFTAVESIDSTVFARTRSWGSNALIYSNNNGQFFTDFGIGCNFSKLDQDYYLFKDSIYHSEDLGQSWKLIPSIEDYLVFCIGRDGDSLIVGGGGDWGDFEGPTIQMTTDLGENWTDIYDNLPEMQDMYDPIEQVKIINSRVFVGCPNSSLLYRDDLLTNTTEKQFSDDNHFVKVYPNPAKDRCCFEYSLKNPSEVIIRIYNQFGRKVKVLSECQVSGTHKVFWDVIDIPEGMYFFTVNHNYGWGSGKVLVLK